MKTFVIFVLHANIAWNFAQTNKSPRIDYSAGTPKSKCTDLDVPMCKEVVPYNRTIFPNLMQHNTQEEATRAINEFNPLIQFNCSKHLKQFLCFIHAPPCTVLLQPIPVCRSLCYLAATPECNKVLRSVSLRPRAFNCELYPKTGLCIGLNSTITPNGDQNGGTTPQYFPTDNGWFPDVDEESGEISAEQFPKLHLFLLVTSSNKIQLLDIRSRNTMDTITVFTGLRSNLGTAVDYYISKNYIYWASNMEGKILRGTLVMDTLRDIRDIVDTRPATVESLAVDWHLCALFWSESLPPAIKTSSLSGRSVTTVISHDLHHPISLTLDPTEGLVFWIDRRGDVFKPQSVIEYYSILTEERKIVYNISSANVNDGGRPKALVADIGTKRLYWVDARSQSLHSVKYDGNGYQLLLNHHERLHEPDTIAIHNNHVIWTDKMTNSLVWVDKLTGEDMVVIKRFDIYSPQNLRLYGQEYQTTNSTAYDKSSLAEKWRDLSSKENMAPYDLSDDDDDDDYYDDEYGRPGKKRNPSKKGGKSGASGVYREHSLLCIYVIIFVLCGLC